MKDLVSDVRVVASSSPTARTNGTATGTGVDLSGYNGAMVTWRTATVTDGSHACKVQESDDNSTFTDVAAADQVGTAPTITSSDSNKVFQVGYVGKKRYVRPAIVTTGATTGGVIGADVIGGFAIKQPA